MHTLGAARGLSSSTDTTHSSSWWCHSRQQQQTPVNKQQKPYSAVPVDKYPSNPLQAAAALCACTPRQAQCTHASMMQARGRQLSRIAVARSVHMVGVWSDVWAQLYTMYLGVALNFWYLRRKWWSIMLVIKVLEQLVGCRASWSAQMQPSINFSG